MLKNLVKYLIIIASIAAVLGTVVYFLKKYRNKPSEEDEFFESDLEDFEFDV